MTKQAVTLGRFIAELMSKRNYTNRSLAAEAGISEGAVRNLLKFGEEEGAKDPDARTLRRVADALEVSPLPLFRLAGYLPPQPDVHSVRASYLADIFDDLPSDKQDVVLGVMEAMVTREAKKEAIQDMRRDPQNPLAGIDNNFPELIRFMANSLIAQYQMTEPVEAETISTDAQIMHYRWKELPVETKERVKALIRRKLSLGYDPTMVDEEWRT